MKGDQCDSSFGVATLSSHGGTHTALKRENCIVFGALWGDLMDLIGFLCVLISKPL